MMKINRVYVGIDAGSRVLKAGWISTRGRHGTLATERQPEEGPCSVSEFRRLVDALSRQGIKKPYVGIIVPDDELITAVVDVPAKSSAAPRLDIAYAEFHRQLRLVSGQYDIVASELPAHARKDSGDSMLVSGINRAASEQICTNAVNAGLDLVYMTTPSNALVAAMQDVQDANTSGVIPILDLGWTSARFVLSSNGRVLFRRAVTELGIKSLIETIAVTRNAEPCTVEAALKDTRENSQANRVQLVQPAMTKWIPRCAEEIRAALSYAHHRYPAEPFGSCVCVGGGTQLPGILDALESHVGIHLVRSRHVPVEKTVPFCMHAAFGMAVLLRDALTQSRRAA